MWEITFDLKPEFLLLTFSRGMILDKPLSFLKAFLYLNFLISKWGVVPVLLSLSLSIYTLS